MREGFDQVLADHRGVESRAAPAQNDSLDLAKFSVAHLQTAELGSCLFDGEPSAHGVAHRVRLLEDLLEHEMRELALVHILRQELDLADLEARIGACERGNIKPIGSKGNDFVIVEIDRLARVRDDRGNIAGKEMLSLPHPEHERTPASRADQHAGNVGMNHGNAIGADDLPKRFPHGFDKRGLRFLIAPLKIRTDEVSEHLRIGLGLKSVPFLFELCPKGEVVFDHAVVHEPQAPGLVKMGMSVFVRYCAMSGPARVTDT